MTISILYYAILNYFYLWTYQPKGETHSIKYKCEYSLFFQNYPADYTVLPIYVFCQYPNSDYEKKS